MKNKIALIILSLFLMISSVSAITNITSCGYSSWSDGETYNIDIPVVDSVTSSGSDYCLDLVNIDNLTLTFNGVDTTTLKDKSLFRIHYEVKNFTFNNFDIQVDETSTPSDTHNFITISSTPVSSNACNSETFSYDFNVSMNNVKYNSELDTNFIWGFGSIGTTDFCGSNCEIDTTKTHIIDNLKVENSFINTQGSFFYQQNDIYRSGSSTCNFPRRYGYLRINSDFENSVVVSDRFTTQGSDTHNSVSATNNQNSDTEWINGVATSQTPSLGSVDIVSATQSILKGFLHNDSDNDNLADANIYSGITNANMYKDLFGYRFIQDFSEGRIGYTSSTGHTLVLVNDLEQVGLGTQIYQPATNNILDLATNYISIEELNAIRLSEDNANLDCSLISDNKCMVTDEFAKGVSSLLRYKGYIVTSDNIGISNFEFNKENSTSLIPMISNDDDVEYFNLQVDNNNFNTNLGYFEFDGNSDGNITSADLEYSKDLNSPLVKARYIGLVINDNIFVGVDSVPNTTRYGFLTINSSIASTNDVTRNYFYNNISSPEGESYVFVYDADTNFFNNYVGTNVVLARTEFGTDNTTIDYSNLNLTGYARYYNEFDNSIYYFKLGNYYEDNAGCSDGDSDGICDSPYDSGGIIDPLPLATYPYDFAGNLFNADFSVSNDYNINLVGLNNGDTITIPNSESGIEFTFTQDSSIDNLVCEMILDDIIIESFYNPEPSVEYSFTKFGWTESSYEFKVKCYDILIPESEQFSDIVVFNVNIDEGAGDGGTEEPVTGTDLDIGKLFTDDPEESFDGLLDLFNLTGSFFGYILIIAFISIFIAIILLLFAFIRRLAQ